MSMRVSRRVCICIVLATNPKIGVMEMNQKRCQGSCGFHGAMAWVGGLSMLHIAQRANDTRQDVHH